MDLFLNFFNSTKKQLLKASKEGKLEEVQQLLKNENLEVNVKDEDSGRTPLMNACGLGYIEIVELLLNDQRVELNLGNDVGQSGFFIACSCGRTEIVKLMLEFEGVDVNAIDNYGWSPLIQSCYYGHIDIVKLILASRRDVNLNIRSKLGETAFDITEKRGIEGKERWENEVRFNKRITNCPSIVKLLYSFERSPNETRFQLRRELGLSGKF